ncbi:hypothetical protein [Ruminococcus sp.]|uniref:hypothetical protein n=1 Tax=Ruminococcus sp. TaxID=41978 RepID=UPI0025D10FC7|nr:hypothetical protein [Ruminococcus sp.]MBQ8966135.1 hypothetical protein [Ruminococcus sp.]
MNKNAAIFALPVCIAVFLGFGGAIGAITGKFALGICGGLIFGAAIGVTVMCMIYSHLKKKEKK